MPFVTILASAPKCCVDPVLVQANFRGGDCSFDITTVSKQCSEGDARPLRWPEQHGTCMQRCTCASGTCQFDLGSCADFICDAVSDGGTPFKRYGTNNTCVRSDECAAGSLRPLSGVVADHGSVFAPCDCRSGYCKFTTPTAVTEAVVQCDNTHVLQVRKDKQKLN
jgi:hypothetical protein